MINRDNAKSWMKMFLISALLLAPILYLIGTNKDNLMYKILLFVVAIGIQIVFFGIRRRNR